MALCSFDFQLKNQNKKMKKIIFRINLFLIFNLSSFCDPKVIYCDTQTALFMAVYELLLSISKHTDLLGPSHCLLLLHSYPLIPLEVQ